MLRVAMCPSAAKQSLFRPLSVLLVALCIFQSPAHAQSALTGGGPQASAEQEGGDSGGDGAESGSETGAATDPLAALLEVLRDDTARQELVTELERRVSGASEAVTSGSEAGPVEDTIDSAAEAASEEPRMSLGGRIAVFTQEIAETAAAQGTALWQSLTSTGSVFDGLQGDELSVLFEAFRGLLIVIALTIAVYITLRMLALPYFRSMGRRATEGSWVRCVFIFMGSIVVDTLIVLAAWAIGYAVTVLYLGDYGQIGFRQSLYLNAFLIVEMIKVLLRAVISPSAAGLRPLPISDQGAKRLYRVLAVTVTILGYGQLLILPITNQSVSYAAGVGVSAVLSVIVVLYLIFAVLRYHTPVSNWLHDALVPAKREEGGIEDAQTSDEKRELTGITGSLVKRWHWFALAYLAFMFITVMSRPTDVVLAYVLASVKIAAAVVVASAIFSALSRAMARGISLPDTVNQKLPLLETRLNGSVPKLLFVLRYAVAAVVILFVLGIIGIIDYGTWLSSEAGLGFSSALVSVFFILLVAYGIWLAMTSWVDYRLNPDYGSVPTSRETTLLTLLRNAATIAILILTLMFTLSEIGLDIGPLLASAGVLGLAIGFGAQKMVQDIITGVFIQFENAINVGDVVTVGGTTGTVEKLTVRSVSLRDLHGVFHIIPFSSVDMVSNFMRDFSYFVCDMGVAYRENVDEVKQAMLDGFEELKADPDQGQFITSDLEWFGLNSFGDSAVVCRARIKTLPGKQWGVGRAYNGILKRIFDARGIEIPFPHQTIFFGEAKDGTTQPIRLEKAEDTNAPHGDAPSAPASDSAPDNGGKHWHDDDPDTGDGDDAPR